MKVQLLIRQYPQMIGLARYVSSLQAGLTQIGTKYSCVEPAYPLPVRIGERLLRGHGYDLRTFFTNYPVAAALEKDAVKHLTTQLMGSLLSFKPGMRRVVITVHDIVPYLVRDDRQQSTFSHRFDRFFDDLAMHNLHKADRLITVSTHTKTLLVQHLACEPEKIHVIMEGVDHRAFHPVERNDLLLSRYNLQAENRYLLYVGSENPRKNLSFLLQALRELLKRVPDARLLKVGGAETPAQREAFLGHIQALQLEKHVLLLDQVPQVDLTALYSLADGFVFPSLYEGFGLPPLEAMACGAPVVCSNAASLPEVVGEAALSVAPDDLPGWVDAMERILLDDALRQALRERGLKRVAKFTWERTARQTLAVYQEVAELKE
jgi:glycosyltransferase involved in cell wall biosynthesis